MKSVVRKLLFDQLATIVSKDEEFDRISESFFTTGETTRFATQASEIMAQVCIRFFNRVSFAFIIHWIVNSGPVERCFVSLKIVTVVIVALNTLCQHILNFSTASFSTHSPGKNATGFSIYKGQDVNLVFFSSMKV